MLGAHEQLGRPVVLCDHLLRHVHRLVRLLHARQPEVTDLRGTRKGMGVSYLVLWVNICEELKTIVVHNWCFYFTSDIVDVRR